MDLPKLTPEQIVDDLYAMSDCFRGQSMKKGGKPARLRNNYNFAAEALHIAAACYERGELMAKDTPCPTD